MTSSQPQRVDEVIDLLKGCVRNGLVPDNRLPAGLRGLAVAQEEARTRGTTIEEAVVALVGELIAQIYDERQRDVAHALFALAEHSGLGIQRRHTAAIEADPKSPDTRKWEDWERTELTAFLHPLALDLWKRNQRALESDGRSGRLVIVGGTSGTGIGAALNEYSQRSAATVIHAEAALLEHAATYASEFSALGHHREVQLKQVVSLPEDIVAELWRRAFLHDLVERIEAGLGAGDVVLSLHASYYYLGSTLESSAVNTLLMSRFADVAQVVVHLVDDIYDVHTRLTRPTQIYGSHNNPIGALQFLLSWRASEHAHLASLARNLGAAFVLLAMKHPADTLDAVVANPRAGIYLQHPIKGPRCFGLRSDEALQLQSDVAAIATALRHDRPTRPVFEPTTIDELRFSCPHDPSDGLELGPRWRHSAAVGSGIRTLADADPLTDEERDRADSFFTLAGRLTTRGFESAEAEMERQVRWRDLQYTLQAATQIAYRPGWSNKGEVAAGIAAEGSHARAAALFEHALGLQVPGRRLLVVHPGIDEQRRRYHGVAAVIEQYPSLLAVQPGKEAMLLETLRQFLDSTEPHDDHYRLGTSLYLHLLAEHVAVARSRTLDLGTMANANDRAFIALDHDLTKFGAAVAAMLTGELQHLSIEDPQRQYDTSFLHSSPHYPVTILGAEHSSQWRLEIDTILTAVTAEDIRTPTDAPA